MTEKVAKSWHEVVAAWHDVREDVDGYTDEWDEKQTFTLIKAIDNLTFAARKMRNPVFFALIDEHTRDSR